MPGRLEGGLIRLDRRIDPIRFDDRACIEACHVAASTLGSSCEGGTFVPVLRASKDEARNFSDERQPLALLGRELSCSGFESCVQELEEPHVRLGCRNHVESPGKGWIRIFDSDRILTHESSHRRLLVVPRFGGARGRHLVRKA